VLLQYWVIKCWFFKCLLTNIIYKIGQYIFIPVTRRVKGYTRFVGKCVTGRRKRFRPHKVYIFLIRITSRVDLVMSVGPSVRMNAEISETIRARLLRFGVQILSFLRKFVSAECHAHSNALKPPKPVTPTILMLYKKYIPIDWSKKILHVHFNGHNA